MSRGAPPPDPESVIARLEGGDLTLTEAEVMGSLGWERLRTTNCWRPSRPRLPGFYNHFLQAQPLRRLAHALRCIPPGWTRSVDATAPDLGVDVELHHSALLNVRGVGPTSDLRGERKFTAYESETRATLAAAIRAHVMNVQPKIQEAYW